MLGGARGIKNAVKQMAEGMSDVEAEAAIGPELFSFTEAQLEAMKQKEDEAKKILADRLDVLKQARADEKAIINEMRDEWANVTTRTRQMTGRELIESDKRNPSTFRRTGLIGGGAKPGQLQPSTSGVQGATAEELSGVVPVVMQLNEELIRSDELTNTLLDSFQDLSNSLAQGADTWEDFGKSALNALKQVVAGLIAKGVAATIEKSLSTLPVGVGLAVGGITGGLAAGLFNTLIPSFAGGGYVSSPTLAMVGDAKDGKGEWVLNSGQIAALSGGGGGRLEAYVSGQSLKFVLDQEVAKQARLGGNGIR